MHRPCPKVYGRFALASLVACLLVDTVQAEPPALNTKVLAFARSKLNQKVGNGQCWTLADEALKAAGAHLPDTDGYGTYVFGRAVPLDKAIPGDVIQFEKVQFKDAGWVYNFPHHTAIVYVVKGRKITVLHQNVNDVKRVKVQTFNLDTLKAGTLKAYRPQPK